MASVTLEMTQKEYDKFKTFLTEAVAEMKATRLTMREQQKEIDRSKAESKKIGERTQKILDELNMALLNKS
ncbi:MAG: hypothetical protein KF855_17805 [Acidobacteria bacterium]|nr:hypothetical protein [Acidobacteriota bacterium]